MGRPKHASHSKPQAKTADIRRAVSGALPHYQARGPGRHLSYNHTQKPDVWDVTLTAPEIYYGGSFLTCNLPPPSEALIDNATAFLDSVLSDFRATKTPMLPLAISTDLMDCDPTPSELMDVDDGLNLDDMNVDVVGPHSLFLAAVPMDVAEDPWSMAIAAVRPPTSAPPSCPAFTDHPMTPTQVCPETPHWKEVSVELSLARRELALVAKALQRVPVCAFHSPVQEPPIGSSVPSIPDFAQSAHESVLAPAAISSAFHGPEHRALCVDSGVEVVVEGFRNLDIADESDPISSTPLDEPIPLTVALPEIQPAVLSPCSESSESSQELDAFNTADLLGLDSIEPLHSTPIDADNGKSPDALGIWADIADLQMHRFYIDLPISYLPEDGFNTFPSSFVREVVSVFDLPAVDRQTRPTEAVDVLPYSEAKVGVIDCVISSQISDKDASTNAPCESVVLVPDSGPYEAGPFASRIGSEEIVRIMKNRSERDAKKTARKARTKERRRREANARSASEPCSPSAPESLSRIKINVSMPNHFPISTSPPPKKLARADTENGVSVKQDISNRDISACPPLRKVSHFRISSHQKQNQGTWPKGTPPKENAQPVKSSSSTKQSVVKQKIQDTKQRALSSPHPLSAINQNIHRIPMIPVSSSSSINSKSLPAKKRKAASSDRMPLTTSRTPSSPKSLFDEVAWEGSKESPSLQAASLLSRSTLIEPTIPTPEARVIHLPYAHSLMRQRNKCITPSKFAPKERYFPKRSTVYPHLEDTSNDTVLSYTETPTRSPSPNATEAQPIRSQKMVLYSAVDNAPEWVVAEATKMKVLPGAVPTTDYHEDIGPSFPTTAFQHTWFGRLKGLLFSW